MPEIRECPPSTLKMLMVGPSGGDDRDPRVPTINVKNIGGAPLDGAAGDLGAAIINAKKHRWWAP
jgi:hypothetical protein